MGRVRPPRRERGDEAWQPASQDVDAREHREGQTRAQDGGNPLRLGPRGHQLGTDYYRWTQWLFLLMLERGLAYRAMAPVNWCPVDKTVLANEQVINGRCWRHPDVEVEKRDLEQWVLKITDYADRLLDDLALLEHW